MIWFDTASLLVHLGAELHFRYTYDPFRDGLDSATWILPMRGFCAHVNRLVSLDCGISAIIEPETLSSPVDG